MATPTHDKSAGRGKHLAGKAKEVRSRWLGDHRTATEGQQQQVAGMAQATKGTLKGRLKQFVDKF